MKDSRLLVAPSDNVSIIRMKYCRHSGADLHSDDGVMLRSVGAGELLLCKATANLKLPTSSTIWWSSGSGSQKSGDGWRSEARHGSTGRQ